MDLLPTHPTPEMTHAVETILDYGCDWTYIVENNLDTPHLYWLHDGSIPPIESLGCSRENVGKIGLKFFKDDVGVGHIGKTSKKVTKVVRYDAPNVVRHGGVSGFSEEFNIIPLGPHRTRVLLRQRFPKGPILSTMLGVPGFDALLTYLVRTWNGRTPTLSLTLALTLALTPTPALTLALTLAPTLAPTLALALTLALTCRLSVRSYLYCKGRSPRSKAKSKRCSSSEGWGEGWG